MKRNSKQFTLIELLVVISIIGILSSMLLPSLTEARKKARIAVEVNNRKQLYAATIMYSDNNNDYYPYRGDSVPWLHTMRVGSGPNLNIILLERYIGEGAAIREEMLFCDSTLFEFRGPDNPYYGDYTNNHTSGSSNGCNLNYYVIPSSSGNLLDSSFYNTSTTSQSNNENALWSCMILNKPGEYWLAHDAGQTEYAPPGASTVFVDGGAQWIRYSSFEMIFVGANSYQNFIPRR